MLDVLNKTQHSRLFIYLVILLCCVGGGSAVVFLFHKDLFLSLDWVKLIMLCFAYTGPNIVIYIIEAIS